MSAWGGGIAFAWGLIAGSFLSLCVDRLPQGLSVIHPRSRCPHCQRPLGWRENIPLVGYFCLRGKCQGCGVAIAWRDPILELGCGLLFFWSWARTAPLVHPETQAPFSNPPAPFPSLHLLLAFVQSAFFLCLLLALAASDWEWRELPDEITLGGWATGLVLAIWIEPGFVAALLASGIAAGGLALVGLGYARWRGRAGVGWGDVKMLGMLGAFLGPAATVVAFFLACITASAAGLVQTFWVFAAHGRGHGWRRACVRTQLYLRHAALPFGLFLALGGGLAWVWAPLLWRLWLG